MKGIKLKIALIMLMLVPIVPFSCKDTGECPDDLWVEPYFSIQNVSFEVVDKYWVNRRTGAIMFDKVDTTYAITVYAADSFAMAFKAPDTMLLFHSRAERKGFGFFQDAFACNPKRPGWMGTRDSVDKIYISSYYDFNEAHPAGYDMSGIVDIFAYTRTGRNSFMPLSEYNLNAPYEAPKRFHLLLKSKPTRSSIQQFRILYYMKNEPGEPSKYFYIETPVFNLR